MRRSGKWFFVSAVLPLSALAGCMPKMSKEEMAQMRPERPAELERLNAFVGTWQATSTVNMAGMDEPITATGTNRTEWTLDGWYLVEHNEFQMGDMGGMKGTGMWTWDPRAGVFRMSWFDNWGSAGRGTATYNERNNTWYMRAKGHGPMGSTQGKGTVTFVDEDTMKWTWREWPGWDWFGLFQFMEMEGTSQRQ